MSQNSEPTSRRNASDTQRLAELLRSTRYANEITFEQTVGGLLKTCGRELDADRVYVVETTAETGKIVAAARKQPDGWVALTPDSEQVESSRSDWLPAVIDGGVADDAKRLACPFVLLGKPVGVVVFCWDQPREIPAAPAQTELVAACAEWISGEGARRIDIRRTSELAEQRYRAVVKGTNDGLFEWNLKTNRVTYSERWKQIVGYPADAELDKPDDWFNQVESSDLAQLEADLAMFLAGQPASLRNQHRLMTADGETRWAYCRAEMVKGDWVKPGATVLDVGITRIPHPDKPGKTKLLGDVDFASCAERAGAITPVPGGVGPMTIACLLANTVTACCRANGLAEPEGLPA